MVRRRRKGKEVEPYQHQESKRLNNPPVGAVNLVKPEQNDKPKRVKYQYDPHLDPQLLWAGKAEHSEFEVDIVPLHVHERISTKAIIEAAKKPEPQLSLFGETPLPLHKQLDFYQHEVNWANRLILGDSLLVMASLIHKEGMAGKVQMIYLDPPYGIKYASNFQPRTDRRDVKDKDEDLTHEPEQIKAYRDTWELGIHSWLTYLRDRLLLCRELLTDSGSIFVQINDENLHLARCVLDEVFGRENFVAVITFRTAHSQNTKTIQRLYDYLLWYSKRSPKEAKIRSLFREPTEEELEKTFDRCDADQRYKSAELKGSQVEVARLREADRLTRDGKYFKRMPTDFPLRKIDNVWSDTVMSTYSKEKVYAVQTNTKVVERCILMTTDPGDLVFDPTCGSGTTAYCAEKWGRRWITCDTSRVAIAIARQRLLTAKFDYYVLKDPERGPSGGFEYETVPHITLKSIAQNTEIDKIAAEFNPKIEAALADLNRTLGKEWREWEVPPEIPHPLWTKEAHNAYWALLKLKRKKTLKPEEEQEADALLEQIYRLTGHRWESLNKVPEPVPSEDWGDEAREALRRFWELKRQKRRRIDESIQRNATQEVLYDR
ncbi:MAG: site-specific DNA-methyltransferase, partial [Planctomycetota bacterium]